MRVELAPEIFAGPGVLPDIVALLRLVAEGRHDWSADPASISKADEYFRNHAPPLAPIAADLARKGMVAAAWSGGAEAQSVAYVEVSTLRDHVQDLSRPAVVVVEDQESDRHFLLAVARALKAERVLYAMDQGWLEVEHGGGGSLAKVADAAAKKYRVRVRVVALLDSDRMVPGQTTGSHRKAEKIAAKGAVTHVLELREAENYAPNRALAAIVPQRDTSARLDALRKLTPEQRGHFDMKKGFGGTGWDVTVPAEQAELYGGLDRRTLRALREGFGKGILKQMEMMGNGLTERDFLSLGEGVVAELRTLLGKISGVI